MSERKPLLTLQYGRGLAALAVAAFHLSLLLGDPRYLKDPIFYDLTWRGNLGVDFFFVLSGFIIFYAHEQDIGQPAHLLSYLKKRLIRLYPVYWIYALSLCILVSLGFGSATPLPQTTTDWLSTIFLIRFDGFELPITPAWSLMHELAFYALFALLILNRSIGSLALMLWVALALAIGVYADEGSRSAVTTYFSSFNLDFIVGIAAYYLWKLQPRHIAIPVFLSGLAMLAGWLWLESTGTRFAMHPLGYAASFGLIIAGAATLETQRNLRPIPLLAFLGDASYSIYLTHLALLGLGCKVAIGMTRFAPMPPGMIYALVFVCAIVGGCVAHLVVEKPVLNLLRGQPVFGHLPRRRSPQIIGVST